MKLGFAGFVLDREAGRLTGPEGEVRLRPQAYRMLETLVGQAPRIVSQEELIERVWGVEHLSPASVKQAVSEVRQALGDDPGRPAIIETVPRRGYRFIAALREILETPEVVAAPPPPPVAPVPPKPPELSTRPVIVQAPRARRPASRLAAVAAVPLLAGLSALALVQRPAPPPKPPAPVAAPVAARPAVAVLGFQNLSGDPKEDWISGALAEILGFELAAPGKIRLIPAEEVARMRRELPLPVAESHSLRTLEGIRDDLGTDLVVSGSYLLAEPGKLRLQVLAQDARTGETVAWTRQTGTPEELIELATAAARGLHATIAGGAAGPPSDAAAFASSTESLRLYSEAVARLRVWDAAAALPPLHRAAGIDPGNPFVRDALADAYSQLGFDARAKETALKALEIARGLPPEIRSRIEGRAREVRGEWEEAAKIYGDLQRLHPDDLEVGLHLAGAQKEAGHADRSLTTVAALRRLPPPAGDDPRLDLAEASAAFQLGDFARCRDAASRAIDGARRRGALVIVAEGLTDRGWALHRLGREEVALADHRVARELFERTGDRGAAASSQVASAAVLQMTGRTAEARKAYETAIPTLREIGDRRREAKALNNFASMLGDLGDLAGVATLLERSLAIKRETGDLPGLATSLANLGNLLRSRGEIPAARARLEEALKIHRTLKNDYGTAFALRGLARVSVREKRPAEALASLEEALALSRKTGDAEGAAEALLALGDLTRAMGRTERARECYGQALEAFRSLNQVSSMVYPLLNLADLDQEQKRYADARSRYDQALPLALKAESPLLEAHVRTGLAWTAEHQGDLGRARSEREKALVLWTKLGDKEQAAKVREALGRRGA